MLPPCDETCDEPLAYQCRGIPPSQDEQMPFLDQRRGLDTRKRTLHPSYASDVDGQEAVLGCAAQARACLLEHLRLARSYETGRSEHQHKGGLLLSRTKHAR